MPRKWQWPPVIVIGAPAVMIRGPVAIPRAIPSRSARATRAITQVAHGGDPGRQRRAGVRGGVQQQGGVVFDQQIGQRVDAGAEREVDVAVDQPWHDRLIGEVEHLGV